MQFESLKVFCDVISLRSFSKAAEANHVTQSAASQIVSQLERRLGTQLIDRSARPWAITELGQVYYQGCRKLVQQYTELEASIRATHAQLAVNVRVAAIYSVGLGDMGQYVERFRAQQPSARVHIDYLHPDRVYERVLAGSADFGLVSFPRHSRELTSVPWREEEMVLACPPHHTLARNLFLRPQQLAGVKYIGFAKGLVIRREVDRFLKEQGVTVDVGPEFDNIENIKKAVEETAGVALLPEPTLRREVHAGTLAAIPLYGCRFVRPLGIIQRRHHRLSATAQRFMDLFRQGDQVPAAAHVNGPSAHRNGTARAAKKPAKGGV